MPTTATSSRPPFVFGTKAETLARLAPGLTRSTVPTFRLFTAGRWRSARERVLAEIASGFAQQRIIVRSSAPGEDGSSSALAGAFLSVADVAADDRRAVGEAIDAVLESYQRRDGGAGEAGGPSASPGGSGSTAAGEGATDQFIVQRMVEGVSAAGVLFTQELTTGAPYFVINYDDRSGRTDTIATGADAYANRTLFVHRGATGELRSERFTALLAAVEEIEAVTRESGLDIEFALDADHAVSIFQVRRLTTRQAWTPGVAVRVHDAVGRVRSFVRERLAGHPGVAGPRTLLGRMPDWNPAEMIGSAPRPLALSLYRRLITDRAWRVARARMGYREPVGESLMVVLAGQPFIDVRLSFNSLLPAALPDPLAERVVGAWIDRLDALPHLHDKVEFDPALTVCAFDFDARLEAQVGSGLDADERSAFRAALQGLTRRLLEGGRAMLDTELERIDELARRQAAPASRADLAEAARLLEDCETYGTIPFAVIARQAFIARTFLDALVARGVLEPDQIEHFHRTVPTVATELVADAGRLARGELERDSFLGRYGHLRPGTYDIESPRYDARPELLDGPAPAAIEPVPPFELDASARRGIDALLREAGYGLDADELLDFAARAIRGREHAKFVFTRSISDALERLAAWGAARDLDRTAVAMLRIDDVLATASWPRGRSLDEQLAALVEEGRLEHETARAVHLPVLIASETDAVIAPHLVDRPNFVTRGHVCAERVVVPVAAGGPGAAMPALVGRVAVIEGADPGYDWIFARGVAGLITKFGGANSHMAIRCAEFGLPAAIGCGEQIHARVCACPRVDLDCAARRIEPLER